MRTRAGSFRIMVAASVAAVAVALAVGPVARLAKGGASRGGPLPDGGELPAFALTDHLRQPLSRESLRGSVWVAGFIFTRCAGQCPLIMARMAALQQACAEEAGLRLVSITVDPSHDTPEVLAAYASRLGVDAARWRLATGEADAVVSLVREGFRLGIGEDGTAQEPITHSVRLALVDHAGHMRGSYDTTDAEAMGRLQQDVKRLLQDTPG